MVNKFEEKVFYYYRHLTLSKDAINQQRPVLFNQKEVAVYTAVNPQNDNKQNVVSKLFQFQNSAANQLIVNWMVPAFSEKFSAFMVVEQKIANYASIVNQQNLANQAYGGINFRVQSNSSTTNQCVQKINEFILSFKQVLSALTAQEFTEQRLNYLESIESGFDNFDNLFHV